MLCCSEHSRLMRYMNDLCQIARKTHVQASSTIRRDTASNPKLEHKRRTEKGGAYIARGERSKRGTLLDGHCGAGPGQSQDELVTWSLL